MFETERFEWDEGVFVRLSYGVDAASPGDGFDYPTVYLDELHADDGSVVPFEPAQKMMLVDIAWADQSARDSAAVDSLATDTGWPA